MPHDSSKLDLLQGTIYAALVRLQNRGWIEAAWGVSDNNRRAKFYSLTRRGERELVTETTNWQRIADVMNRVLACLGIYSTIAYGVGERVKEFGVRMALGATAGDIRQGVVRQTLVIAAIGVAIGTVASLALTRLMTALLFDTSATDVTTFVSTAAVFVTVALAAGYLPAVRASRVSPMEALRDKGPGLPGPFVAIRRVAGRASPAPTMWGVTRHGLLRRSAAGAKAGGCIVVGMRLVTVLVLTLLATASAFAQTPAAPAAAPQPASSYDAALAARVGADERGMRSYVFVLLRSSQTPVPKGPERDEMFKGHFANMTRLADEGKLVMAGPLDGVDGWRGLFIFATTDLDEARRLVSTDPVIVKGEMVAEYHSHYATAALMLLNGLHKTIQRP